MSGGSTVTINATFTNRDAADRGSEHLVQEHGIPRGDVFVRAVDDANSVGVEKSGPDASSGTADGSAFEPPLRVVVEVSVDVNAEAMQAVESVFRSAGASGVGNQ